MLDDRIAYVVDDEASVRRSLALLLGSAGFTVRDFASGDAFLHAAAANALPFGCVLLDLRMPGLDGLAVQRALTARGVRLPVVIVTAHGDIQLAVQAIKAGACDFVEKPYAADAIIQATEAALVRGDEERARARDGDDAAARVAALTPREVRCAAGPRRRAAEQGDRLQPGAERPHGGGPPSQPDDQAERPQPVRGRARRTRRRPGHDEQWTMRDQPRHRYTDHCSMDCSPTNLPQPVHKKATYQQECGSRKAQGLAGGQSRLSVGDRRDKANIS